MKKHIEYEQLKPLEVAKIGERDGWPIKGLVVTDGEESWRNEIIRIVSLGSEKPYWGHRYCARPIEKIEWESGDTVQTDQGVKGVIIALSYASFVVVRDKDCSVTPHEINVDKLKPWTPGYGYTTDGQLIEPPEGYKIVPEGKPLPNGYLAYISGEWLNGSNYVGERAEIRGNGSVRAYAKKIIEPNPVAESHNRSSEELIIENMKRWTDVIQEYLKSLEEKYKQ